MSTPAVSINDLSFIYPGQLQPSLKHLDFIIPEGERFGIFGPNGAGKTTLMNCMTGLLDITNGSVEIFGTSISKQNKNIQKLFGFVPQDFSFYQELSPVENLAFFGAWAGLKSSQIKKRTDELLEVLGLSDVRDKQVQKFSGGMKRRVNLAISVMNNPKILFLDEPTVGVDVQTRHAVIDYLLELNRQGTTLVYTSHQLNEAQQLCNTIAMIDGGRIIAHDHLNNLLQQHREDGLEGLFIKLTGRAYRDSDV